MKAINKVELKLMLLIIVFFLLGIHCALAEVTGVTRDEIKIGGTMDLTGPIALIGQSLQKGEQSYFNFINEKGGIYGRKIKYLSETDNYEPSQTVAAAKKLIHKDKIFCFNGTLGTPTNMALIPILEQNKIPLIGPIGSSPSFAFPPKKYIFTTFALYSTQTSVPIDYIVNNLKMKRIAIIYQDDELGESCLRAAQEQLKKYNMELVAKVSVKRGAIDVSSQAARLRKSDPEIIVFAVNFGPAARLIKEAEKMGWKTNFFALPPSHDKKLIELAGPASEGILGASVVEEVTSDAPAVVEYRKLLEKYFPGSSPNTFGLWGFSCAKILVEAMKRAGKEINREKLVEAMETMKNYDNGIVPPLTYGPNDREGVSAVYISKVQNGRFIKITDWIYAK